MVRLCDNVISGAALKPKFEDASAISSVSLQVKHSCMPELPFRLCKLEALHLHVFASLAS